MNWIKLASPEQVSEILKNDEDVPCLIFKYSSRCDLSELVWLRLQQNQIFEKSPLRAFFLDIIRHPDISKLVAKTFEVQHESPQVLLIRDGFCTYEADHLEITPEDIVDNYHERF